MVCFNQAETWESYAFSTALFYIYGYSSPKAEFLFATESLACFSVAFCEVLL